MAADAKIGFDGGQIDIGGVISGLVDFKGPNMKGTAVKASSHDSPTINGQPAHEYVEGWIDPGQATFNVLQQDGNATSLREMIGTMQNVVVTYPAGDPYTGTAIVISADPGAPLEDVCTLDVTLQFSGEIT